MLLNRHILDRMIGQLNQGKILLLFGARRVGKTVLLRELIRREGGVLYNGELPDVRDWLTHGTPATIREIVGGHRLVAFDEVQSIPGIGQILKVLHDTYPQIQWIATGSSAFELAQATGEPLAGCARIFHLYPLSFAEIRDDTDFPDAEAALPQMLRFGLYPEVYGLPDEGKREELMQIAGTYLYRDVLMYGNLRRPDILQDILRLLAYQVGTEVSLNEIANATRTSVHTVRRYLDLLEKSFVIVGLNSLSRNLRNEIGKSRKYYFVDLGIRNALIQNFNAPDLRPDTGQLWENFCVIERMKRHANTRTLVHTYFWRTYQQQEIDYIEERDGTLHAFEFKWKKENGKRPKIFLDAYPGSTFDVITKRNLADFLL